MATFQIGGNASLPRCFLQNRIHSLTRSLQCNSPFFFAVALSLCMILVRPAVGQTAQEELQRRNIRALGDLLGAPSPNAPMMHPSGAPGPLVSLPQHINSLEALDAQVENTTDGAAKAALEQHRAMMELHFSQQEWKLPVIGDTKPDPLISIAFHRPGIDPVLYQILLWNHAALDLTAVDHTGVPAGQDASLYPQYAEQFGPPCSSRALAIVHLSMIETLNLVEKKYQSYKAATSQNSIGDAVVQALAIPASSITNMTVDENSAVEYAAYVALVRLYPYQAAYLTPKWQTPSNSAIAAGVLGPNSASRIALGQKLGTAVANEILQERASDTSQLSGRCIIGGDIATLPTSGPGYSSNSQYIWQVDPIHPVVSAALGSEWSKVATWIIPTADRFRPDMPNSTATDFMDSFELVRVVGGDPKAVPVTTAGVIVAPTNTERTEDQTQSAIFWAYDGSPGLCAPPRLYNELVTSIATSERPITNPIEMARLLALTNIAMADAAISSWEAKYCYRFARPITAIRAQKDAHGGQPYASWTPLGAQGTNTRSVNITPTFPAYPSGHATFGGALFQALRDFYQVTTLQNEIGFSFVSDEWNGINLDPKTDLPRPLLPRHYQSLSQAESENAMSRVYMGIHWKNDADAGTHQGNCVANFVDRNLYLSTGPAVLASCQ